MLKKKEKDRDKLKRSSSEFSFFDRNKVKDDGDDLWVEDIWQNMTVNERINAVIPYYDSRGRGALTRAVRRRDHLLVEQLLLDPRVDVNQRDIYGNTPLHHSVLMIDSEMIILLLNSPRLITNLCNNAHHTVADMLHDLKSTNAFPQSLHDYCHTRILGTSHLSIYQ